jgi:hypothetical protein
MHVLLHYKFPRRLCTHHLLHWLDLPDIRCLAPLVDISARENTEIHDVISADGTIINDDIYKIRPLRFPVEYPMPTKRRHSTIYMLANFSIKLLRIRNTFLTSNLGLSCFEPVVFGAGGSTSMGVDMSSVAIVKAKCGFQNLHECFDSDQQNIPHNHIKAASLLH